MITSSILSSSSLLQQLRCNPPLCLAHLIVRNKHGLSRVREVRTTKRCFEHSMSGCGLTKSMSSMYVKPAQIKTATSGTIQLLMKEFSTLPSSTSSSKKRSFVPQKAPVKLTPKARQFFKGLLEHQKQSSATENKSENSDTIIGIMLRYRQSTTGEPRMVYTFDFVTAQDISNQDEPVSLEIIKKSNDNTGDVEEEIPKSPQDSINDGLPKLYIHQHAFLKLLGSTIDIDLDNFTPILYDREGNELDPNA